MNLQPSEFIANNLQRIATYNMVPGTVVRLRNHIFVLAKATKGPHQWLAARTGHSLSHEQFVARMRKHSTDTANLPVILFDPLDTNTDTDNDTNTDTDINTDKENNNDKD